MKLPRQGVFEFCRDNRDAVQKYDEINRVLVFLAVMQLADDDKPIEPVKAFMFGIHAALRLIIRQPKFRAAIFDPFAEDGQCAVLTDFMGEPFTKFLRCFCAILLLKLGVFVRLCGCDKVQHLRGNHAEFFVIVGGLAFVIARMEEMCLDMFFEILFTVHSNYRDYA